MVANVMVNVMLFGKVVTFNVVGFRVVLAFFGLVHPPMGKPLPCSNGPNDKRDE